MSDLLVNKPRDFVQSQLQLLLTEPVMAVSWAQGSSVIRDAVERPVLDGVVEFLFPGRKRPEFFPFCFQLLETTLRYCDIQGVISR